MDHVVDPAGPARLARLADSAFVEAFVIDVNGVPRGKWLRKDLAAAMLDSGIAMPRSAYLLDIWGRDVMEGGIAFDTGDPDGRCFAVPHSVAPMPWAEGASMQALLTMHEADGSLFYADPRGVLSRVLDRYAKHGLTPAIGVELEFYLVDPTRAGGQRIAPRGADESQWRGWQTDALGLWEIHDYEPVLRDLLSAAAAQDITLETLISENGPGQFEVTLAYAPDALRIADHAVLFKRAVKQVARRHGLCATFMAKPFGDWSGSGMHVHMSVRDQQGRNIFAGDSARPAEALYHGVGGLVAAMPDTMLAFAPHANSFRRFAPGTHAPTFGDWGHDNRMSAIRVILSNPAAARIEHRVAGADCNPYLAFAAMLGAMLDGIITHADPGPETLGDKPGAQAPRLPIAWSSAVERFAGSHRAGEIFGPRYQSILAACKRQEIGEFRRRISDVEYDAYLRSA